MESKQLIWLGMIVGSSVGGFVPMLWGDGYFSFSSIIFSTLGGVLGIYAAFKVTH